MNPRYWLLLEKSDATRISKGIDGYPDVTGEVYHYDSLVPNHRQLQIGDFVVLRKEDDILGISRVGTIAATPVLKIHRRCPACSSTDIRERTTKQPRWKCGKCANEFGQPDETSAEVTSYAAALVDFGTLDVVPSVHDVKRCAASGDGITSQLSILELDPNAIRSLLEGSSSVSTSHSGSSARAGQGFGLSQPERKQVESRAMQVARELYEADGWDVEDRSLSHPYDLLATRGNEKRFVEVKGTTGSGHAIQLTHGEVKHVRSNRRSCALVVVSDIVLEKSENMPIASGGAVTRHEDPWVLRDDKLEAVQYRYTLT